MKDLMKYTYLLDTKNIRKRIESLWSRYQKILDNKKSNWEDLNEARAILYSIGYLYPEKIVLDSLKKRIKYIRPAISLDEFLSAIDIKNVIILKKYAKNKRFIQLKDFYLIVKNIKNRTKNGTYLDEGRFNKIYNILKPRNYS